MPQLFAELAKRVCLFLFTYLIIHEPSVFFGKEGKGYSIAFLRPKSWREQSRGGGVFICKAGGHHERAAQPGLVGDFETGDIAERVGEVVAACVSGDWDCRDGGGVPLAHGFGAEEYGARDRPGWSALRSECAVREG